MGRRGQTALEYAVLTTVTAVALAGIIKYALRAVQANLYELEQQANAQAVSP